MNFLDFFPKSSVDFGFDVGPQFAEVYRLLFPDPPSEVTLNTFAETPSGILDPTPTLISGLIRIAEETSETRPGSLVPTPSASTNPFEEPSETESGTPRLTLEISSSSTNPFITTEETSEARSGSPELTPEPSSSSTSPFTTIVEKREPESETPRLTLETSSSSTNPFITTEEPSETRSGSPELTLEISSSSTSQLTTIEVNSETRAVFDNLSKQLTHVDTGFAEMNVLINQRQRLFLVLIETLFDPQNKMEHAICDIASQQTEVITWFGLGEVAKTETDEANEETPGSGISRCISLLKNPLLKTENALYRLEDLITNPKTTTIELEAEVEQLERTRVLGNFSQLNQLFGISDKISQKCFSLLSDPLLQEQDELDALQTLIIDPASLVDTELTKMQIETEVARLELELERLEIETEVERLELELEQLQQSPADDLSHALSDPDELP